MSATVATGTAATMGPNRCGSSASASSASSPASRSAAICWIWWSGELGDDAIQVVVPGQQRHHGEQVVGRRDAERREQCVHLDGSDEPRHRRILRATEQLLRDLAHPRGRDRPNDVVRAHRVQCDRQITQIAHRDPPDEVSRLGGLEQLGDERTARRWQELLGQPPRDGTGNRLRECRHPGESPPLVRGQATGDLAVEHAQVVVGHPVQTVQLVDLDPQQSADGHQLRTRRGGRHPSSALRTTPRSGNGTPLSAVLTPASIAAA